MANELPVKAFGWAASDTSGTLAPFHFSRRFLFIILISFFVHFIIDLISRAGKMASMTSLSRFSSAGFATLISTLSKTTGVSPPTLSFLGILLSFVFYYKNIVLKVTTCSFSFFDFFLLPSIIDLGVVI